MNTVRAVIMVTLLMPGCTMPWTSAAARQELLSISQQVRLCMPAAELDAIIHSAKTSHLEKVEGGSGTWVLQAPFEIGAGNWILYVKAPGGYVTSVLFRTEDGDHAPPPGAPTDRFTAVGQTCGPA